MSGRSVQNFRWLFLLIFATILFWGDRQPLLASDSALLFMKAQMKVIRNISLSYDDHFIANPFKVQAKGVKLENLINVKISYNGYRPIKLIIKQIQAPDIYMENFVFYHELEKVDNKINYVIYFNETQLPVIDGVIFSMDNPIVNPIIDKQIGLDVYIPPFQGKKCVAGRYITNLQLNIMEIE